MKVIIPTKNRAGIMSTHRVEAFEGADKHVLVHNQQQYDAYSEYLGEHEDFDVTLHVTHTEPDTFGLTRQREWACQNLAAPGEWFVFADDNITKLTGPEPYWRRARMLPVTETEERLDPRTAQPVSWRDVYSHEMGYHEFRSVFRDDVARADKQGTCLAGFATTGNHYFRSKKIRTVGYVIGKMMLWCNDTSWKWDHTVSMEDFRNTAEALLRYGTVVIDNFLFPECTHYQPGGMGTYLERIPVRRRDVQVLLAEYADLFRVKNRKDFAPNTDLAVRFTTQAQVDRWRKWMAERAA